MDHPIFAPAAALLAYALIVRFESNPFVSCDSPALESSMSDQKKDDKMASTVQVSPLVPFFHPIQFYSYRETAVYFSNLPNFFKIEMLLLSNRCRPKILPSILIPSIRRRRRTKIAQISRL
jgi:hypothetical protein